MSTKAYPPAALKAPYGTTITVHDAVIDFLHSVGIKKIFGYSSPTAGSCHINSPTMHDEAPMPFGSVKGSVPGALEARQASPNLAACAGSAYR